jgi:GT2 family glycosyltransferase
MLTVRLCMMTFHQGALTVDALQSLRDVGWPVSVSLLDNSGGADAEYVSRIFGAELSNRSLQIDVPTHNLGVAAGRNFLAKSHRADWLLFTDNDAIFREDLSDFLTALQGASADVLYPVILGTTGRVWSAGGSYNRVLSWSRNGFPNRQLEEVDPRLDRCADWGAGACIAVRQSTFTQLGGFRETFGIYGAEDVDFGLRAKRQGYIAQRSPLAPLIHLDARRSLPPHTRSQQLRDAAAKIREQHARTGTRALARAFLRLRLTRQWTRRERISEPSK